MQQKTRLSSSDLADPKRVTKTNDYYDCPFCGESRGRLGVLRDRGIFHCFNCNASGRLRDLPSLERFEEKIRRKLVLPSAKDHPVPFAVTLPFGWKPISEESMAHKYLRNRGITAKEIYNYEIGYTITGIFAQRIIIPIRKAGIIRYFVGRTYINDTPKYMNAAAPKTDLVFRTFEGKQKEVVICEGIFDAISTGRVLPSIALLGKTATSSQLETIKRLADKAIIMLDADAKIDGFKLNEQIKYRMKSRIVMIQKGDPGSMNVTEVKEALSGKTGIL